MKKRWAAIFIILAIVLAIAIDPRMVIVHYTIEADPITAQVRLALITDLHSCYYGKDMNWLVKAIDEQQPDLILLGGDYFDSNLSDDNALALLDQISSRYPCCYVTGNHEAWGEYDQFAARMAALEEYGVIRLGSRAIMMDVRGQQFRLCGMEDPYYYLMDQSFHFRTQLKNISQANGDGVYTILLSHRPELIELYADAGFDLALCGHAHGGQVRIPGLINGLYAPNQGWLPAYAGGVYELNSLTEIVSRGLARESTLLPRVFNRPELVVIDLN